MERVRRIEITGEFKHEMRRRSCQKVRPRNRRAPRPIRPEENIPLTAYDSNIGIAGTAVKPTCPSGRKKINRVPFRSQREPANDCPLIKTR
jgi:hypothetical protein